MVADAMALLLENVEVVREVANTRGKNNGIRNPS